MRFTRNIREAADAVVAGGSICSCLPGSTPGHLGDMIPKLLEIKAKANVPLNFRVQIELGNGKETPPEEAVQGVNKLLDTLKDGFRLQ